MTTASLEDFQGDIIEVVCERCDKRSRHRKIKMIKDFGLATPLEKVLARLAECSMNPAYRKPCEARFEDQ